MKAFILNKTYLFFNVNSFHITEHNSMMLGCYQYNNIFFPGKLQSANNSRYKNDMIWKEVS